MPGELQVNSECRFARAGDLTVALAAVLWDVIEEAVARDNAARLVLSGGSSPLALYNVMRELPLPWGQLHLSPSDERWVETEHEASNEGMLRRELLGDNAPASLLSLAKSADDPQTDADRVERALAGDRDPWDAVLLGMGTDGHTASLFPDTAGLADALDGQRRCMTLSPPGAAQHRLTLTLKEILNSRRIVLLLRGADKWRVYREALAGDDVAAMPVRAVLHQQQVPVDVYWSFD